MFFKKMNKVVVIDDAIDKNIIDRFSKNINNDLFIDVGKTSYAQTETNFQIKFYKDNFQINEKYSELRNSIFKKIETTIGYKLPIPSVSRNCFLKYNEPGMRSAMHVEHEDIHGRLGFLFYLSTEDSGYLRWVDQNGEDEYFSKYPEEKQQFIDSYSYRQLYGDIQVQPIFNRLVIFETLGSHLVDVLESSINKLPRLCIMGWPLCEV